MRTEADVVDMRRVGPVLIVYAEDARTVLSPVRLVGDLYGLAHGVAESVHTFEEFRNGVGVLRVV